jgi:hypothetical protein
MVVLAAVWKSPLTDLLPKQSNLTRRNLALLFKQTMNILGDLVFHSPILCVDLEILKNAMRELGLDHELRTLWIGG